MHSLRDMKSARGCQSCKCRKIFGKTNLSRDLCFVVFSQGKTQKMKPGVKEAKAKLVPVLAKGPPAQPLEDISMRIYLCDGLLGMFQMTDVLGRL